MDNLPQYRQSTNIRLCKPGLKRVGGVGVLSMELELDVNSPFGIDPIGQDTDEEITVDVSVTMFKAKVSLIE